MNPGAQDVTESLMFPGLVQVRVVTMTGETHHHTRLILSLQKKAQMYVSWYSCRGGSAVSCFSHPTLDCLGKSSEAYVLYTGEAETLALVTKHTLSDHQSGQGADKEV